MVKVYTASKLHHYKMWLALAEKYKQLDFNARWLRQEHLEAEIAEQQKADGTTLHKAIAEKVWIEDIADVIAADYCLVYAAVDEHLRGALVEAGAALAAGKIVIVIGQHQDYGTWQYHPNVRRFNTLEGAIAFILIAKHFVLSQTNSGESDV